MKKFCNLVLVIYFLVSPFGLGQRVEARGRGKGGRVAAARSAKEKVHFKNVCDEIEGSYVPGDLLVTMSEDLDPRKTKLISSKTFYELRKNNSFNFLKSKISQNYILDIEPLYEPDVDSEASLSRLAKVTKDSTELESLKTRIKFHSLMRKSKISRSYVLSTTYSHCASLEKLVDDLKDDMEVESIDLNRIDSASTIATGLPNDQFFPNQYNIRKIEANGSWATTTGNNIKVGIVDQYIKTNHQDLQANIDIVNSSLDSTSATISHGTQVASMIAAVGDNNIGIVGVAPNAKIVFSSSPRLQSSETVSAITHLVNRGIRIINLSITSYRATPSTDDARYIAITSAIASNISVIVAAGNENVDVNRHVGDVLTNGSVRCTGTEANPCYGFYPAIPGVIAVGATTSTDTRAGFSTFGNNVDLSAPGEDVPTATFNAQGDTYNLVTDGTSFSAPTVAGAAALLLSLKSDLSPAQVREILVSAGDAITTDRPIGPRLNVRRAIDELNSRRTPPAPILDSATNNSTDKTLSASWSTVNSIITDGTINYQYKVYQITSDCGGVGPCQVTETDRTSLVSSNPVTTLNSITSVSTTNLTAGNYRFKVQACNNYTCSALSNARDFRVAAGPVAAVSITAPAVNAAYSITTATTNVNVTWNAVTNATSYSFSYTKDGRPPVTETLAIGTTSKNLTGLGFGTYIVTIIAINADGVQSPTPHGTRTFTISQSPNTITNLSAGERIVGTLKLVGRTPTLTWDAITDASYKVEYQVVGSTIFTEAETDRATNSYTFPELAKANYIFRVSARFSGASYGGPSSITVRVVDDATEAPVVIIPPEQFSHVARVNKALISTRSISWSSPTAYSYSTVLTKPNLTTESSSGEQASLTLGSSLPLGDYSIAVTAVNIVGEGLATAQGFTLVPAATVLPGAVTITSPALSAGATDIVVGRRPAFTWNTVDTAFAYELSLEKLQPDSRTVIDKSIVSSNSYPALTSDLELGRYRLKVHAINIVGHKVEDTVVEFSVADASNGVPGPVTITAPTVNLRTTDTTPLITWNAVPTINNVSYYELEIASASSSATTATYTALANMPVRVYGSTSYEPNLPLGRYRIRMRARNSTGFSATPAERFFTVTPAAVTFNVPASIAGFTRPGFSIGESITWIASPGASGYKVQIDTSTTFTTVTIASYVLPTSLTAGDHTIWVIPTHSIAGDGISQGLPLTVVASSTLGPVTITAPTANQLFNTARPSFTWGKVTGATRYEITIIKTLPNAQEIVTDLSVPSPSTGTVVTYTLPTTTNLAYGTYTVKVRAINARTIGDYGLAVTFRVNPTGATATTVKNVVTVTGPVGYPGTATHLVDNSQTINITWTAPSPVYADFYKLTLLKRNADHSYTPVNVDPIAPITTTSYPWNNVLDVGIYKVKVIASNFIFGDGPAPTEASLWSFEVDGATALPDAPTGITVVGLNAAGITSSKRPTINWLAPATGARYYRVAVNRVNADGTLGTLATGTGSSLITGTSFLITGDLAINVKYRVNVFAINGKGEGLTAGTSTDFYVGTAVTVLPTAPVPTAVAPVVSAAVDITTLRKPTLKWSAASNSPVYYELQIIDGASGNLVQGSFYIIAITGATSPQYLLTTDLANGYYKFRVRAFNAATIGNPTGVGPWSTDKAFYVTDVPAATILVPDRPTINNITANSIIGLTPTIIWNSPTLPTKPVVYYKAEFFRCTSPTSCSSAVTNGTKTVYNATTYLVPSGLLIGSTSTGVNYYKVRITALNARGLSPISEVIFRTQ